MPKSEAMGPLIQEYLLKIRLEKLMRLRDHLLVQDRKKSGGVVYLMDQSPRIGPVGRS